MTAKISIFGVTAKFKDGVWTCSDKDTERLLNAVIPNFEGSDPNTEQTAAQFAVDNFGGEIISVDEMEAIEGMIY